MHTCKSIQQTNNYDHTLKRICTDPRTCTHQHDILSRWITVHKGVTAADRLVVGSTRNMEAKCSIVQDTDRANVSIASICSVWSSSKSLAG